jgi:cytochrome c
MSGFEWNKLIASILLASLIAMLVGTLVNILYKPILSPAQRGYQVAVTEDSGTPADNPTPEAPIDVPALMKLANAEAGVNVAKKCIACHTLGKGEAHKIGPNLWNIVGDNKGVREGYKYSDALIAKGGKWDEEALFHFLHKPKTYIPGTKMSFIGINKPEDIANVIGFLKTLTSN